MLESITDPVIPRARGAYRFANVATLPVSPRSPELTMHELVQDLDAGCDDVRNDIVQTTAHGPPTRKGRDRAGSDAAVSDDHDDPIAADHPGDRGLLGDKVELFRSHHRQLGRTMQRLVNTSPDIADDARNSAGGRLSNLQAASRNDLVAATALFVSREIKALLCA